MKGTKIFSRPGKWLIPSLLFLLAFLFPAIDFLVQERFSPAGLGAGGICLMMALFGVIFREKWVRFQFTDKGIAVSGGRRTIPYKKFLGVTRVAKIPGKKQSTSFAIDVYHEKGIFRIPSNLNVSSERVYSFLLAKIPPRDPLELPDLMKSYYQAISNKFGNRKLFFHRRLGPTCNVTKQWVGLLYGFFIGLDLALLGNALWVNKINEWYYFYFCLGLTGLLFLVPSLRWAGNLLKQFRGKHESILILNPLGIALHQNELVGKLRWKDVSKIQYPARGFFSSIEDKLGILIGVSGASFLIKNQYDTPADQIYRQLLAFWDPEQLEYLDIDADEMEENDDDEIEKLEVVEEVI